MADDEKAKKKQKKKEKLLRKNQAKTNAVKATSAREEKRAVRERKKKKESAAKKTDEKEKQDKKKEKKPKIPKKKNRNGDQGTLSAEITFPMQKRTSQTGTTHISSCDEINLSQLPDGAFAVICDGVEFHTHFQRSLEQKLFVLLSGSPRHESTRLPQFERRSFAALLPGSILWVSDPTLALSNEILMGWYIGTKKRNVTQLLARLVDKVSDQLGLSRSDIVFYASSGGGFAALMCARELPGSNCLIVNPHIDLMNCNQEYQDKFAETFAEDLAFKRIQSRYGERVSVLKAFPSAESLPRTVYAQNSNDKEHVTKHYELFCDAYRAPKEGGVSANGRVLTVTFEHGDRHGQEPRGMVPLLIAEALAFFDHQKKADKK